MEDTPLISLTLASTFLRVYGPIVTAHSYPYDVTLVFGQVIVNPENVSVLEQQVAVTLPWAAAHNLATMLARVVGEWRVQSERLVQYDA